MPAFIGWDEIVWSDPSARRCVVFCVFDYFRLWWTDLKRFEETDRNRVLQWDTEKYSGNISLFRYCFSEYYCKDNLDNLFERKGGFTHSSHLHKLACPCQFAQAERAYRFFYGLGLYIHAM